jgi:hypothetical protein
VKIGRNDPCPCGSGKKYKHCCLQNETGENSQRPGTAQSVAEEIGSAAAEQPFESLEELNDFTRQLMNERNRWARAEFCALSPEQMSHLLYKPFSSPETIEFSTDIAPGADVTIMRLFMTLVDAVGEGGLKTTAKGNLPLKFCKAVAQQLQQEDDGAYRLLIGGIRSERDLEVLHCTRLVAELAGLIRKYRGQFVLTRKCREMLDRRDSGSVYFELFKAYTTKFDWGYRDGYPEAELVQHTFLYTLFLLASFGTNPRSQRFYEDKFLTAFPMALEMFPETAYSPAEESARRCYFVRALDRFAAFFGLAELIVESQEMYPQKYTIHKSKLLDRFLAF